MPDREVSEKYTAGSLRAASVINDDCGGIFAQESQLEFAEIISRETQDGKLIEALKRISALWPEPPLCAPVNPKWVGENDGKIRAILLEGALNIARTALGELHVTGK